MGSGASISNDDEAASGHIHKVYKRNGDEAYKIQMYAEAIYWYSKAIQEINGNIIDNPVRYPIFLLKQHISFSR